MPTITNDAFQTFYGTLPLIIVLLAIFFRNDLLLRDILKRLGSLENEMKEINSQLGKIRERIVALETKQGISYIEH